MFTINSESVSKQEWLIKLLEISMCKRNIFVTVIDKKVSLVKNEILPGIFKLIKNNNLNDFIKSYNKTHLILKFKNGSSIMFITDENTHQIRALQQDYLFVNGSRLPNEETYTQLCLRTKEKVFVMR